MEVCVEEGSGEELKIISWGIEMCLPPGQRPSLELKHWRYPFGAQVIRNLLFPSSTLISAPSFSQGGGMIYQGKRLVPIAF